MSKNILSITFIALIFSLFFLSCEQKQEKKSKQTVAVSSYVLYDMVRSIAESTIDIVNIIPIGTDIHSFEPTPKVMSKVENADIVFYNGAGLEPWISTFHFKSKSVGLANFLRLKSLQDKNQEHNHEHHDGHCSHTSFDPHIWFDIENMLQMLEIISYELITLQPHHKDVYLINKQKYAKMLRTLDNAYKNRLSSCKLDVIITDHNAFSYLGENYNFTIETLSGFSPDAETSPKDVIRIIDQVKEKKVPVIFFENFNSDRSMKSVAQQTGVRLDSLHPLGNITLKDQENNRNYKSIMEENLEKISKALMCQ